MAQTGQEFTPHLTPDLQGVKLTSGSGLAKGRKIGEDQGDKFSALQANSQQYPLFPETQFNTSIGTQEYRYILIFFRFGIFCLCAHALFQLHHHILKFWGCCSSTERGTKDQVSPLRIQIQEQKENAPLFFPLFCRPGRTGRAT